MKQKAIVLLVLAVVLVVFVCHLALDTRRNMRDRKEFASDAQCCLSLNVLDIGPPSTNPVKRISVPGFSIEVPLKGITTVTNLAGVTRVGYGSGENILLSLPQRWSDLHHMILNDTNTPFLGKWYLKHTFGKMTSAEVHRRILTSHPFQLPTFQFPWTRSEVKRFLIMKGMMCSDSTTIHTFSVDKISGFQLGSFPQDNVCRLIFCSDSGETYHVRISLKKAVNSEFSQSIINDTIRSFKIERGTQPTSLGDVANRAAPAA